MIKELSFVEGVGEQGALAPGHLANFVHEVMQPQVRVYHGSKPRGEPAAVLLFVGVTGLAGVIRSTTVSAIVINIVGDEWLRGGGAEGEHQ